MAKHQLTLPQKVEAVNKLIANQPVTSASLIRKVLSVVLETKNATLVDNMKSHLCAFMGVTPANRTNKNEFSFNEVAWLDYMLVMFKYADSVIDNPSLRSKAMNMKLFVLAWIKERHGDIVPLAINSEDSLPEFYNRLADLLVYQRENRSNVYKPTVSYLKNMTTLFAGMRLVDIVSGFSHAFEAELKGATWEDALVLLTQYVYLVLLDDDKNQDDYRILLTFVNLRYPANQFVFSNLEKLVARTVGYGISDLEYIENASQIIRWYYMHEEQKDNAAVQRLIELEAPVDDRKSFAGFDKPEEPSLEEQMASNPEFFEPEHDAKSKELTEEQKQILNRSSEERSAEYQNRREQLTQATLEPTTQPEGDTIVGKYEYELREFLARNMNTLTEEGIRSFLCQLTGAKPHYSIVGTLEQIANRIFGYNNLTQFAYLLDQYINKYGIDAGRARNSDEHLANLKTGIEIAITQLDNVDKHELTELETTSAEAQSESLASAVETDLPVEETTISDKIREGESESTHTVVHDYDRTMAYEALRSCNTGDFLYVSHEGIREQAPAELNHVSVALTGFVVLTGPARCTEYTLIHYYDALRQVYDSRSYVMIPKEYAKTSQELLKKVEIMKLDEAMLQGVINRLLDADYVLPYDVLVTLILRGPQDKQLDMFLNNDVLREKRERVRQMMMAARHQRLLQLEHTKSTGRDASAAPIETPVGNPQQPQPATEDVAKSPKELSFMTSQELEAFKLKIEGQMADMMGMVQGINNLFKQKESEPVTEQTNAIATESDIRRTLTTKLNNIRRLTGILEKLDREITEASLDAANFMIENQIQGQTVPAVDIFMKQLHPMAAVYAARSHSPVNAEAARAGLTPCADVPHGYFGYSDPAGYVPQPAAPQHQYGQPVAGGYGSQGGLFAAPASEQYNPHPSLYPQRASGNELTPKDLRGDGTLGTEMKRHLSEHPQPQLLSPEQFMQMFPMQVATQGASKAYNDYLQNRKNWLASSTTQMPNMHQPVAHMNLYADNMFNQHKRK